MVEAGLVGIEVQRAEEPVPLPLDRPEGFERAKEVLSKLQAAMGTYQVPRGGEKLLQTVSYMEETRKILEERLLQGARKAVREEREQARLASRARMEGLFLRSCGRNPEEGMENKRYKEYRMEKALRAFRRGEKVTGVTFKRRGF